MKPYPRWFKRSLMMVLLGVFVSGLLLAPTLLLLRGDIEVPWHLASEQRVGVAAIHVGMAMVTLMFFGALWTVHMRAGWRKHRLRASGALLCAGMLALGLSALFILYSGDEGHANIAAWLHVGVGIALFLPFAWHVWLAHWRHPATHHTPRHPQKRARQARAAQRRPGSTGLHRDGDDGTPGDEGFRRA